MKKCILLTICLGQLLSQTYNVIGKVLDSKTKKPISNVNIFINHSDIGTTSDIEGNFNLLLNEEVSEKELHIKMMGYKEVILYLDSTKNIICPACLSSHIDLGEILITTHSLELESINIHAHKHTSSQISDITLSGQQLSESLSGNIAATLINQPNIGISSFGVVTSKPVLRGFSGNRFLLVKDGNITGDLSQTSIDHVITLEMTEVNEIEIIRGPKALVYGPNAIGGVINTSITGDPKAKFDKVRKKINMGLESFNSGIYGNIFFYIPIKNNQLNLSFNNRKTHNQTSPIGELENTESKTINYKLGFTKYYISSYLNLLFENYNMQYGIPPSEEGHINGVDLELVKNTFQLNYHHDISWFNFNQFDIKYNFINYEHGEYESNSDFRTVGLAKNTYNAKIEFKSYQAIIGSELNYKQFSSEGLYWTPRTDEIEMSFYGFWNNKLNKFDLLSSFRIGYLTIQPKKPFMNFSNLHSDKVIKRNFKFFSSSIGIKRNFKDLEFGSWLMNTMRAPSLEELYSDGPHLGTYSYEVGTPSLDLEKIFGVESSIRYQASPSTFSLTTFYNYSPYYFQMSKMGECDRDFIAGKSHPCSGADYIEWGSGVGWLYKYQPEGIEAIIKGLEFNFGYNYNSFKIVYDFSLVRGDNLTAGEPLAYISPDKHSLVLGYEKKIMNYKFRLSKIHDQKRIGEFETTTPSSFFVDFIVSYTKKNQNITLQANNIFNKKYYNHLSKIKSIMPENGRSILINYKIIY